MIVDSYGTNLYINDQLSIINDQLLFRISGGVFEWKMKNEEWHSRIPIF